MYRVRRFGVVKTATVVALLYMVIIAIFIVPVLLLIAAFGSAAGSVSNINMGGIISIGLLAIVGYGIFGWIATAIGCLLYNLVAGWTGGIEVQLEAVQTPTPPPAWTATPPPPPPTPSP